MEKFIKSTNDVKKHVIYSSFINDTNNEDENYYFKTWSKTNFEYILNLYIIFIKYADNIIFNIDYDIFNLIIPDLVYFSYNIFSFNFLNKKKKFKVDYSKNILKDNYSNLLPKEIINKYKKLLDEFIIVSNI